MIYYYSILALETRNINKPDLIALRTLSIYSCNPGQQSMVVEDTFIWISADQIIAGGTQLKQHKNDTAEWIFWIGHYTYCVFN